MWAVPALRIFISAPGVSVPDSNRIEHPWRRERSSRCGLFRSLPYEVQTSPADSNSANGSKHPLSCGFDHRAKDFVGSAIQGSAACQTVLTSSAVPHRSTRQ